jgi:hypothetical protein
MGLGGGRVGSGLSGHAGGFRGGSDSGGVRLGAGAADLRPVGREVTGVGPVGHRLERGLRRQGRGRCGDEPDGAVAGPGGHHVDGTDRQQ